MSMFKAFGVASLLALGAAGFACKYDPQPQDGTQACFDKKCPSGYLCGYDDLCHKPESLPVLVGTGGAIAGKGGATVPGTGGAGLGGVKGTGGAIGGTGGVTSVGGIGGQGGVIGYGGITSVVGVGGTTGMGGATTPVNAGSVVTIANQQAQGAMTGFGWVAFAALDTVTDPTCRSPLGPMPYGTACGDTAWSSPAAYCITGFIPAVPSPATDTDFSNNWGIQIGVNATPIAGGILGQPFSSLAVSMTGMPLTGLRVTMHRKADPDATNYCADFTSGTSIPFVRFSTTCWDATKPGTYLLAADVPNIDKIGIQIPSVVGSPVTVTNLCLTGITFTK